MAFRAPSARPPLQVRVRLLGDAQASVPPVALELPADHAHAKPRPAREASQTDMRAEEDVQVFK